jgi:hypothetical protein
LRETHSCRLLGNSQSAESFHVPSGSLLAPFCSRSIGLSARTRPTIGRRHLGVELRMADDMDEEENPLVPSSFLNPTAYATLYKGLSQEELLWSAAADGNIPMISRLVEEEGVDVNVAQAIILLPFTHVPPHLLSILPPLPANSVDIMSDEPETFSLAATTARLGRWGEAGSIGGHLLPAAQLHAHARASSSPSSSTPHLKQNAHRGIATSL